MLRIQSAFCAFLLTSTAAIAQALDPTPFWGHDAINLERAREAGLTGAGITIGVMDSILQIDHPEYADRLLGTLDIETFAPFGPTYNHHATHVAGTIAGQNTGVAPNARLVAVRVTEILSDPYMRQAYEFGLQKGVRIFNNSWGISEYIGGEPSTIRVDTVTSEMFEAFRPGHLDAFRLTSQAGAVQVFATGNGSPNFEAGRMEGGANPGVLAGLPALFPELKPYWVAVTSHDRHGEISDFADRCGVAAQWCLAAPGEDIVSSLPGSGYGPLGGSSMATPHVSGALAIGAEMFPAASGPELIQLVLQTATDLGDPGIDPIYGWGGLNVGNIVDTVAPRTGASFANASFARFAALGHAGASLRQRLSLTPAGAGEGGRKARYASLSLDQTGARLGLTNPEPSAIWLTPFHGMARLGSGAASQGMRTRTTGFLAGLDFLHDEALQLGAAGGFSQTRLDASGAGDSGRVNAAHAGLYGSYRSHGWLLQGTGLLTLFDQSLIRREIAGAQGTSGHPVGRSALRGSALEADLRLGYEVALADGSMLTPSAAMTARSQWTGAFRESGAGIFSLDVPAQTQSQFAFGPGLRWSSAPLSIGEANLRIEADIAHAHVLGDRDHRTTVTLLGRPIEARSAAAGRDILRVGSQISLSSQDEALSGFIGYDGSFQRRATSHVVSAGMRVSF